MKSEEYYLKITENWVRQFVIQLGLCPFASKPFLEKRIRYVVCKENDPDRILMSFYEEAQFLLSKKTQKLSNTLFIVPSLDKSFSEYLELYDIANSLLDESHLNEEIQLASFHPLYQFAGTKVEEVSNFTNRTPSSIIHLLRVLEVEEALETFSDPAEIHKKNVRTMNAMGKTKLEEILAQILVD